MAAKVTDKLWEVSDIVEMLEQWELANFKPEYQFVVRQYAIGKGHSVSVMWRGGEVDTIFGFEKEADAPEWIKENIRDLPNTVFYACGPNELVEFAEHLVLTEMKVPKEQMKTEKWG